MAIFVDDYVIRRFSGHLVASISPRHGRDDSIQLSFVCGGPTATKSGLYKSIMYLTGVIFEQRTLKG